MASGTGTHRAPDGDPVDPSGNDEVPATLAALDQQQACERERHERVEQRRQEVADGTYKVDALELSKSIIRHHLRR